MSLCKLFSTQQIHSITLKCYEDEMQNNNYEQAYELCTGI